MNSDVLCINDCCKIAMKKLIEDGVQVDSIVTDPPYELGFMSKSWDKSGIANDINVWKLALQILKPGGHLLAFGGTRTYHRMACAIEDAGFEIRDCVNWIYGQGFPKSLNISKAIDKMAGAEIEVDDPKIYGDGKPCHFATEAAKIRSGGKCQSGITVHPMNSNPATDAAKQWDGWHTALKPAHEPCVLARKPLDKGCNIAQNVLKHGTGGINVDGCRVGVDKCNERRYDLETTGNNFKKQAPSIFTGNFEKRTPKSEFLNTGRFPANVIHDGSDVIMEEFAKYGERKVGDVNSYKRKNRDGYSGEMSEFNTFERKSDTGSAARFFYSAKASAKDRMGSKHPTVKPIALMRYLCRLITPPGGVVLDMFAGTGTTGQAALEEGFNAILIEKETEYFDDIQRRLEFARANRNEDKIDDNQLDLFEREAAL
jgi:DNA modification methylase